MHNNTIALFGQSEKGVFHKPYLCKSLEQLVDIYGNPPTDSQGLLFAIQAILYNRDVLFCRVGEEGFSLEDYIPGMNYLKEIENIKHLCAICLPGVGDPQIIDATKPICKIYKSILIITEKDLYDYLSAR